MGKVSIGKLKILLKFVFIDLRVQFSSFPIIYIYIHIKEYSLKVK